MIEKESYDLDMIGSTCTIQWRIMAPIDVDVWKREKETDDVDVSGSCGEEEGRISASVWINTRTRTKDHVGDLEISRPTADRKRVDPSLALCRRSLDRPDNVPPRKKLTHDVAKAVFTGQCDDGQQRIRGRLCPRILQQSESAAIAFCEKGRVKRMEGASVCGCDQRRRRRRGCSRAEIDVEIGTFEEEIEGGQIVVLEDDLEGRGQAFVGIEVVALCEQPAHNVDAPFLDRRDECKNERPPASLAGPFLVVKDKGGMGKERVDDRNVSLSGGNRENRATTTTEEVRVERALQQGMSVDRDVCVELWLRQRESAALQEGRGDSVVAKTRRFKEMEAVWCRPGVVEKAQYDTCVAGLDGSRQRVEAIRFGRQGVCEQEIDSTLVAPFARREERTRVSSKVPSSARGDALLQHARPLKVTTSARLMQQRARLCDHPLRVRVVSVSVSVSVPRMAVAVVCHRPRPGHRGVPRAPLRRPVAPCQSFLCLRRAASSAARACVERGLEGWRRCGREEEGEKVAEDRAAEGPRQSATRGRWETVGGRRGGAGICFGCCGPGLGPSRFSV